MLAFVFTFIICYFCDGFFFIPQGLARNLGPVILTLLKPHILRLASDSTEACQRSVAEMIAGKTALEITKWVLSSH